MRYNDYIIYLYIYIYYIILHDRFRDLVNGRPPADSQKRGGCFFFLAFSQAYLESPTGGLRDLRVIHTRFPQILVAHPFAHESVPKFALKFFNGHWLRIG